MKPDERSIDLAARVADGSEIDWASVELRPGAPEPQIVRHLHVIARLAALHRRSMGDASNEGALSAGLGSWGPFVLIDTIGAGSFGEVYRAWDTRLDREVALKLLHATAPSGGDVPDRVIAEARLLARVRHPNVLTVYGAECIDPRIGIWTEFIEGETLETILARRGPLPAQEVVEIGIDLTRALDAVHAAGMLHRDIKTQNVMREVGGRIVLMDFGTGLDLTVANTRASDLSGTPLYLAPELFSGCAPTVASDIYALSVLLFRLLTGNYPVAGESLEAVRAAYQSGARPGFHDMNGRVPSALARVIARGLELDPARRYHSARVLEEALRVAGPRRRRRRRLAWIGGGAAAFVAALAVALWHQRAPSATFHRQDWILLGSVENHTGNAEFDGEVEDALGRELSNSGYVSVLPRARIDDTLRLMKRATPSVIDLQTARDVALRDSGVRFVVTGAIEQIRSGYGVSVEVVEPQGGAVLASDYERAASIGDVPIAIRRISDWIRIVLGETPSAVKRADNAQENITTPSLAAVRAYTEAFEAGRRNHWAESEAFLRSALAQDPGFASADALMAWALWHQRRPKSEYLPMIAKAAALVDSTTERERHFILGSRLWLTGDTQGALGEFQALLELKPSDYWTVRDVADLDAVEQRPDERAALLGRASDLRPNDFFTSIDAARALTWDRGLDAAHPYVARATALTTNVPPSNPSANSLIQFTDPPQRRVWLKLDPVHEMWVKGQAREAATALDEVATDADVSGDAARSFVASFYLSLGQLRRTDQECRKMATQSTVNLCRAEVALARGDRAQVVADLMTNAPDTAKRDPMAAFLLVSAGDLPAARRALRDAERDWAPLDMQAPEAELAIATDAAPLPGLRDTLERAARYFSAIGGVRAFAYREDIATALRRSGDTASAISVLEETTPLQERALGASIHTGYFWERTQSQLADLYRKTGQTEKARAIEDKLVASLGAADEDDPLLVELRKRNR